MRFSKLSLVIAFASASVLTAGVSASAAPDMGTATAASCTITKIDGTYRIEANGNFNSSYENYKINGWSAILKNNGGKNVREISRVSIEPTAVGSSEIFDFEAPYKFASSLKHVEYYVYNGGKVKGKSTAECQRIGWGN